MLQAQTTVDVIGTLRRRPVRYSKQNISPAVSVFSMTLAAREMFLSKLRDPLFRVESPELSGRMPVEIRVIIRKLREECLRPTVYFPYIALTNGHDSDD